jgi:hypothetical protein
LCAVSKGGEPAMAFDNEKHKAAKDGGANTYSENQLPYRHRRCAKHL